MVPGKSLVSAVGGAEFMQSLEDGMKQVMRQAVWDAVVDEGPRMLSLDTAEHNVNRLSASSLKPGATYAKWSHPIPSMFETTKPGDVAAIEIPDSFTTDLFGDANPIVDSHTQSHGYAPEAPGFTMRSPLVGLTVSHEKSTTPIAVKNLSKPIFITIPVDTSSLSDTARMIFAQQARCVWWNNNTYSDYGCNVTEASILSITCKCNQLTLSAIHHDQNAPACGDGVLQAGESCDDRNFLHHDGCSPDCIPEPYCTCTGEPSVCECLRLITNNQPENFGVKGTIRLGGFLSKQDFINGQAAFQDSMAQALEMEGLGGKDVVVLKICYGSDCTENWIVARRRVLRITHNTTQYPQSLAPQLRAQQTVVDFFINKGTFKTQVIFKQLSRAAFASAFINKLKEITGRDVTATIANIVVIEDGNGFNKSGFGPNSGDEGGAGAAALFTLADIAAGGLSISAIIVILVLAGLLVLALSVRGVIIPLIKKLKAGKQRMARQKAGGISKKQVHTDVLKAINELSGANNSKNKYKFGISDEVTGKGKEEPHMFDVVVFDVVKPPSPDPGKEAQVAGTREELMDTSGAVMAFDSIEKWDKMEVPGHSVSVSQRLHTRSQAPSSKAGGKWNNARSRLANLEAQLDALLDQLPTEYLPTPSESGTGSEMDEANAESVVKLDEIASEAGETASQTATPVLPSTVTGRTTGVLKIKISREKSKYKRPSMPDALDSLQSVAETPSRCVRKPPTPSGHSARPSVTNIRRAPNLSSIFDESYSNEDVIVGAPRAPRMPSNAAENTNLIPTFVLNEGATETLQRPPAPAAAGSEDRRARKAWAVDDNIADDARP